MYADKDRQREAVREATRRYRVKKGITRVSPEVKAESVIPDAIKTVLDITTVVVSGKTVRPSHHPTCRCFTCVPPKVK
jgi:hypothetical protein